MSQHKTTLPIDLSKVLASLPPRSTVERINIVLPRVEPSKVAIPTAIEIVWSNDEIKTGRTYPIEFSLEKLSTVVDKPVEKSKKVART